MMDMLEIDGVHVEVQAQRNREASRVAKKIDHTRKLLAGPGANDPKLKALWEQRLERQLVQLAALCR